jgi:hypothetical protein
MHSRTDAEMPATTTPTRPAPVALRMASGESFPATITHIERLIDAASTLDEIKHVIALANAALAYASTHYKEQRDMIQRAKVVKLLVERRLGEMLKATTKHEGGRPPQKTGSDVEPVSSVPTLADLGIDKKTSARAQKLAALPDEQFAAVAAGEIPVSRAITPKPSAARRAPQRTKVAAQRREAVAEAQVKHVSMFVTYARMAIKELQSDREWSDEEIRLAAELADLCARVVRRVQALPA